MNTVRPTRSRARWSALLDFLGSTGRDRPVRVSPSGGIGRWSWLYADRNGVAAPGPIASFASQTAAESWLDENVAALRAFGISAASLRDGEHAVYGPAVL